VFSIAITLRAGRSGDLVLVQARVSFHLQNINDTYGVQTTSNTMGTGVPSRLKMGGGLNLTILFRIVER
jgi:hypothetical protein